MTRTLLTECDACDGDGRISRPCIVYERGCGLPHWGEGDVGPCSECDGEGFVEVETISMEDRR